MYMAIIAGLAAIAAIGGAGWYFIFGKNRKLPKWSDCKHASCWTGSNANQRMMNILSPHMPDGVFKDRLNWMKGRKVDTAHVFLSNTADGEYASPGYSVYGSTCSWQVNQKHVDVMKSRMKKLRDEGLAVVVWLFADDSSKFNKDVARNFDKYVSDLKAAGLLDMASIVVAGLELNEYFSAAEASTAPQKSPGEAVTLSDYLTITQVSSLTGAIRKVWSGKIGVHQTSNRVDLSPIGDIVFYQVNPGMSAAQIEAEARRVVGRVGKPVNFFELSRHEDRALCEAAFRGGAYAVGNW